MIHHLTKHHSHKPNWATKRTFIIGAIMGLVLGLILSLPLTYFFGPQAAVLDVTFINPRQALVFWQSQSPTVGYLKTGTNRFWRPTKVTQISQQADVIHTVMLDQLPLDGLYVSPHTEDQSWWHRSPVQLIRYQETTDEINNLNNQENTPDSQIDSPEDVRNNLDTESNAQ